MFMLISPTTQFLHNEMYDPLVKYIEFKLRIVFINCKIVSLKSIYLKKILFITKKSSANRHF